jgi:hypothetical protein
MPRFRCIGVLVKEAAMTLKMTLWISTLLFIAMMWNVISAYKAMGEVNVQNRFEQIGLLHTGAPQAFPLPPRKPLMTEQFAAR